jgi:hypothetical protein
MSVDLHVSIKISEELVPSSSQYPNVCVVSPGYGLLGYYATSSSNTLPTFRDNVSFPSSRVKKFKNFFTHKDATDTLSRNVGKRLPLDAV